jgi:hypothetical protein
MRFAEEAIQVSKYIVFRSSDTGRLSAVGDKFECTATKKDGRGWVGSTIHINAHGKGIKASDRTEKLQKLSSPLRAAWLIELLSEQIRSTPNISNDVMRQYLKGYATDYAITDNLLQTTRSEGKAYIFGKSDLNVQYARVLKKEMEERGHPVKLIFSITKHTMMNVCKYVAEDANRCLKSEKNNNLQVQDVLSSLPIG